MSFSSLIFTALFLPLFLLIYYIAPGIRQKNRVLLLASLLFYAFSGVRYLILLLVMAVLAWALGRKISMEAAKQSAQGHPASGRPKTWLCIAVAAFLGVLIIFKYTGFFIRTAAEVTGNAFAVPDIVLPLGISFYTFKLISYVADIYSGQIAAQPLPEVLLYTVNFHQIAQGPIARFGEMEDALHNRTMSAEQFSDGAFRFIVGLAKKTILADHLGELAAGFLPLSLAGLSPSVEAAWLGSICYMLELYLDFSAYIDMAIGLGEMIGFEYPENFNYPYAATSVRDFWRRWHITLSSFFRDYVYIPLGGSRVSFVRLLFNLLVVWLLTGFWHGASWNFILWGLYYFVFIALENVARRAQSLRKRAGDAEPVPAQRAVDVESTPMQKPANGESVPAQKSADANPVSIQRPDTETASQTVASQHVDGSDDTSQVAETLETEVKTETSASGKAAAVLTVAKRVLGHLYTLLVVFFGWVLFRFSDFPTLHRVLRIMLGLEGAEFGDQVTRVTLRNNLFFLLITLIAVTPLIHELDERTRRYIRRKRALRNIAVLKAQAEAEHANAGGPLHEPHTLEETDHFFGITSGMDADSTAEILQAETKDPVGISLAESTASARTPRAEGPASTETSLIESPIESPAFSVKAKQPGSREEAVYYLVRMLLAAGLLLISVMAMIGQSYQPFLYNQF